MSVFGHSERYRVMGVDLDHVITTISNIQNADFNKISNKADMVSIFEALPIVKGKFEKDIQVAFLQDYDADVQSRLERHRSDEA